MVKKVDAGAASFKMYLDTDPFQQEMRRMSNQTKRMSKELGFIGASIAGFGVGLIAPLAASVLSAARLQETMNRVTVAFGAASEEAVRFSRTISDDLNRAFQDVAKSMATFKGFFTGLGFSGEESTAMAKELEMMMVDFSSFFDVEMTEAMTRFISAMAGSPEVLDQFGINLKQAAVEAELAAMGINKTAQQATEMEKSIARLNILRKTFGKQGVTGDAARTSDQFANALRGVSAEMTNLKNAVGAALIPIGEKFLPALRDAVQAVRKFVEQNPGLVKIIATLGVVALALGGLVLAISGLGLAVAMYTKFIAAVVAGNAIIASFATGVVVAIKTIGIAIAVLVTMAGGIGPVLALAAVSLGILIPVAINLYNEFDRLEKKAKRFEGVLQKLDGTVQKFKQTFSQETEELPQFVTAETRDKVIEKSSYEEDIKELIAARQKLQGELLKIEKTFEIGDRIRESIAKDGLLGKLVQGAPGREAIQLREQIAEVDQKIKEMDDTLVQFNQRVITAATAQKKLNVELNKLQTTEEKAKAELEEFKKSIDAFVDLGADAAIAAEVMDRKIRQMTGIDKEVKKLNDELEILEGFRTKIEQKVNDKTAIIPEDQAAAYRQQLTALYEAVDIAKERKNIEDDIRETRLKYLTEIGTLTEQEAELEAWKDKQGDHVDAALIAEKKRAIEAERQLELAKEENSIRERTADLLRDYTQQLKVARGEITPIQAELEKLAEEDIPLDALIRIRDIMLEMERIRLLEETAGPVEKLEQSLKEIKDLAAFDTAGVLGFDVVQAQIQKIRKDFLQSIGVTLEDAADKFLSIRDMLNERSVRGLLSGEEMQKAMDQSSQTMLEALGYQKEQEEVINDRIDLLRRVISQLDNETRDKALTALREQVSELTQASGDIVSAFSGAGSIFSGGGFAKAQVTANKQLVVMKQQLSEQRELNDKIDDLENSVGVGGI